jgi:arginine metabolism regulation protein II
MYTEIYGLPETWLSLVSQTTRLANVLDIWRVCNAEVPMWFRDSVQCRTERLENMVCTFVSRPSEQKPHTPHHYMLQALNAALLIFLYRRIRDVNPLIIQSHVQEVIDSLTAFDSALHAQAFHGPGTGWPAFIAACEATSPASRQSLALWLEKAHTKSGLAALKTAVEVARKVWELRDGMVASTAAAAGANSARPAMSHTWVTICRELDTWVMVC